LLVVNLSTFNCMDCSAGTYVGDQSGGGRPAAKQSQAERPAPDGHSAGGPAIRQDEDQHMDISLGLALQFSIASHPG
jgi:hypothetical protein